MAGNFDRKEYYRKYYQKNKERLNAKSKAWRLAHPERTREIVRKSYYTQKARREQRTQSETQT